MKMKLFQRASRLLPCLLLTAGLASAFAGCKKKDMSMKMNEPRNIHGVANFGRTFGDLNQKQLNVAQAIGISPITRSPTPSPTSFPAPQPCWTPSGRISSTRSRPRASTRTASSSPPSCARRRT